VTSTAVSSRRLLALAGSCLMVLAALVHVAVAPEARAATSAQASAFQPLPYGQLANTTDSGQAKLSSSTPLTVQVTGVAGVPSSGVTAVSLDVTTTNSQSSSWVSVLPADGGSGITNHFTTPGRQAQNNVYVAPGADGKVRISTGGGNTDVIVAVTGYFTEDGSGSTFVPAESANRLLDTRTGVALQSGASMTVTLPSSRPASVNAAALSITTTDAPNRGWLALTDPGSGKSIGLDYDTAPASSSLISGVDSTGRVTVTNKGPAATHVLVDLQGYFVAGLDGGGFVPAPTRAFDTRADQIPIPPGGVVNVPIAGVGDIPSDGVVAFSLDVTVLSGAASGYAQVYPASQPAFGYSTVNFGASDRRSNSGLISAGLPFVPDDVAIRNRSNAEINILVDVMGYFEVADEEIYETTPVHEPAVAPAPVTAQSSDCAEVIGEPEGTRSSCIFEGAAPVEDSSETAATQTDDESQQLAASIQASGVTPVNIPSWCPLGEFKMYRTEGCQAKTVNYRTTEVRNGRVVETGIASFTLFQYAYTARNNANMIVETKLVTNSAIGDAAKATVSGTFTPAQACKTTSGSIPAASVGTKFTVNRGAHALVTTATGRGAVGFCNSAVSLSFINAGYTPAAGSSAIPFSQMRCNTTTASIRPTTGCVFPAYAPTLFYDGKTEPNLARHVARAQASGLPAYLTRLGDAKLADQNYKQACGGLPAKTSYSCDEYPVKSSKQGLAVSGGTRRTQDGCFYPSTSVGKATGSRGVSVCLIPATEQNRQGALNRNFYAGERLLDGDRFYIHTRNVT